MANNLGSVNSLKCGTASISDSIFNCNHRLFMLISYCWSLWLSDQSWHWWWRRWCLWWWRWWQRQSWWCFYQGGGRSRTCLHRWWKSSAKHHMDQTGSINNIKMILWYLINIWSSLLRWYHNICDMLSKSSAKHRMDQTGSIIPIKIYINKLDNCMLKEHFISVTSITRKIEKI